jgi:ectoine hydroxylase-related dioxygenase (phytanoyl-CoA dioxygenase family)
MNRVPEIDPGFAIVPGCLSNPECDELVDILSQETVSRSRAGARHLMSQPAVAALAASKTLIHLASKWLGPTAVPFRATLFEKSSITNWLIPWHQDTALPLRHRFSMDGWGPWSEKAGVLYAHAPAWALSRVVALRVHLDASTAGNGPLRVIPSSHLYGVLTDQGVLEYVSQHDQIECLAGRGGVVVMHPLLIHASSKAQIAEPRRVLHIEYADSLHMANDVRLAVV